MYIFRSQFLRLFRSLLIRPLSKERNELGATLNFLRTDFRPSKSPYWKKLTDYIGAEQVGRNRGECFEYAKDCTKSLYKQNKYS